MYLSLSPLFSISVAISSRPYICFLPPSLLPPPWSPSIRLPSSPPGKRYSLPNSRIMIHQPLGGAQGQQTDIEIQANEILHHKANLNGYLAYHTGQSYDNIVQVTGW